MRRKGFRNGVSDIVIACPVGRYHGAYIELKRDEKAEITDDQKSWIKRMRYAGYYGDIAIGLDWAIETTQNFLSGKPPLFDFG